MTESQFEELIAKTYSKIESAKDFGADVAFSKNFRISFSVLCKEVFPSAHQPFFCIPREIQGRRNASGKACEPEDTVPSHICGPGSGNSG